MKNINNGKRCKYVYNPQLKDFFLEQGCTMLDADTHKGTGKMFWIFDYEEIQQSHNEWNIRPH